MHNEEFISSEIDSIVQFQTERQNDNAGETARVLLTKIHLPSQESKITQNEKD